VTFSSIIQAYLLQSIWTVSVLIRGLSGKYPAILTISKSGRVALM